MVDDPTLIARPLGYSRLVLMMSPELLAGCAGPLTVNLIGPNGETHAFRHRRRLSCSDPAMLRAVAIAGLGVAPMPEPFCGPACKRASSSMCCRAGTAGNTPFMRCS